MGQHERMVDSQTELRRILSKPSTLPPRSALRSLKTRGMGWNEVTQVTLRLDLTVSRPLRLISRVREITSARLAMVKVA